MDEASTDTMADEWITLFDGTGFDHWRGYKQDAMPEGWVLDGDAMYASTPDAGMDVVTRDTYTNSNSSLSGKSRRMVIVASCGTWTKRLVITHG